MEYTISTLRRKKRQVLPVISFMVKASECKLSPGDVVSPETIVGVDTITGKEISADFHGVVETMSFSWEDRTFTLGIRLKGY